MKLRTAPKTMLTKLAIGAAAVSLLAVGGVATVSAFSDSATSTVTVAAGDINLQLGTVKAITLDLGQNVKPGMTSVVQTIVVNNKGSLPLTYTAATGGVTGTLPAQINVTVRDMTVPATPVAIGGAMKMSTIALPSKVIAANSSQTVEITYAWPNGAAGAENAFMNATGNAVLTFSATQ